MRFCGPICVNLHDPFGLPDMDKAAHRIKDALASRRDDLCAWRL